MVKICGNRIINQLVTALTPAVLLISECCNSSFEFPPLINYYGLCTRIYGVKKILMCPIIDQYEMLVVLFIYIHVCVYLCISLFCM